MAIEQLVGRNQCVRCVSRTINTSFWLGLQAELMAGDSVKGDSRPTRVRRRCRDRTRAVARSCSSVDRNKSRPRPEIRLVPGRVGDVVVPRGSGVGAALAARVSSSSVRPGKISAPA